MFITNLEEIRAAVSVLPSPGLPEFVHQILLSSRAVLEGHFALQSGAHAEKFLRFRNLGRDRSLVDEIARRIHATLDFDVSDTVVLAPESAGFFLGEAFARIHHLKLAVAQISDRRAPRSALRSGELVRGARVLLINDVATTGGSLSTLHDLARSSGAEVAGAVVFSTLDGKAYNARLNAWGIPGRFLVEARWPTFRPDECPRCSENKLPSFPASELN